MQLNILEVLNEYSIPFDVADSNSLKVSCPFHDDKNPSGVIFKSTGVFHCRVCDTSKGLFSFLNRTLNRNVYFEVHQKFGVSEDKILNPKVIERAHAEIFSKEAEELRKELYARGITDEVVREFRIGFTKDRLTIPIRNKSGHFVNIRRYRPGASEKKVINQPGYGNTPRLFPVDQLQYDDIVLHGGELKALSVLHVLNRNGIGSLCSTHGEGSLPSELISSFVGKNIYICFDIDQAGRDAAIRVALRLKPVASWLSLIDLPLDIKEYPRGDVNDFVKKESSEAFYEIVKQSKKWEYDVQLDYDDAPDPISTTLTKAVHAEYAKKRIIVKSVVSSLNESPFTIPKKVEIKCDRDTTFCEKCPVICLSPENQELEIPAESPALIKMVGDTEKILREASMEAFNIPKQCKKCSFEAKTFYNIEESRLSEELDLRSTNYERNMQTAYCIGRGLELNECYSCIGRMFPHPRTQQASLLISEYTPVKDTLSTYECEDTEQLKIFQPKEWKEDYIRDKLDSVYTDIEANVTHIWQRRDFHLMLDLAYHSPLELIFRGKKKKGWVEIVAMGDSAQGKSETVDNLLSFYNLGEKVDCKGATRAGLLGGQESVNKRFFVKWGAIPINDRRLVILEELNGASTDVISKLTEMRSSGFASITGMATRRTYARTRLIALANPRSVHPISNYNYGVDALVELVGSLQDLRRFDAAIILERNEVDVGILDMDPPEIEHVYTSPLCRELILWSWTVNNAVFENEGYIIRRAREICEEFTDEIPIVARNSMHEKLARLSAALAGRTFSHVDGDTKLIYVRNCHVDYLISYLRRIYSTKAFGYAEYSLKVRKAEELSDPKMITHYLKNKISNSLGFVEHLLSTDTIDVFFVQDTLGMHPDDARSVMSFFIMQRALKRDGKQYRKTDQFTRLLKELQIILEDDKPPDYLRRSP